MIILDYSFRPPPINVEGDENNSNKGNDSKFVQFKQLLNAIKLRLVDYKDIIMNDLFLTQNINNDNLSMFADEMFNNDLD